MTDAALADDPRGHAMNRSHLVVALTLSLSLAALDASAQVDPSQPAPSPPVANPQESPWGAPPPPVAVAPEAQPVYVAQQPVYVMSPSQSPYARYRPTRVPYEGGPVPPGGRLETRTRLGLAIGGGVTFGVTWLLTAMVGALAGSITDGVSGGDRRSSAWWLVAPVVGPVAFGLANDSVPSGGWFLLTLDTVAQGAGLAMLLYGITNPVTYVVFDGHVRREAPARPRWALLPGTSAAPHGATFSLTF